MRARKTAATPLYERAYADGDRAIWSPELERLTSAPFVQNAMRKAVSTWRNQAVADGYGAMNPGAMVDRGGRLAFMGGQIPAFPNIQFWDYTKRMLDDQVSTAIRAGQNNKARTITSLLQSLRGDLDRQVPSYTAARDAWAGPSAYLDAIEDGKSLLSKNMTAEELRAQFAGMTDSEREAYRVGAVSAIRNQMMSNPAKMPDFTRTIRSDEMRRKLNEIMPTPQAAENFQRALSYEIGSSEITAQSLGNSATARRLAAQGEGDSIYGQLAKDLLAHKMGVGWLKAIWNGGSEPVRRRIQAASDAALARLLTSIEPAAQIGPRTRPSPRAAGAVAPTARGVGYGLATSLQDQNAQQPPYAKGGYVRSPEMAMLRSHVEMLRDQTHKHLAYIEGHLARTPMVPEHRAINQRDAQILRNRIAHHDNWLRVEAAGPPPGEAGDTQRRTYAAGGRVHASSETGGRPLGEKAFAAVRKARARAGKALPDGRTEGNAKASTVIVLATIPAARAAYEGWLDAHHDNAKPSSAGSRPAAYAL
jgi:hypothetical protein